MIRILSLSFLLYCSLFAFSSTASAGVWYFDESSDALSACLSYQSGLTDTPAYPCGQTSTNQAAQDVGYISEYLLATKGWNAQHHFIYKNTSPDPVSCNTDTIAGGPVNGGWGSGIYNVNSCAYSCGTDYSKLDGQTSMYDAQSCIGIGQEYISSEPSDYPEPPIECFVNSQSGCLDMDKQPSGSCPTGTTYGRVNDKDVCVPSGTPTDPFDPGSAGTPDAGGDMQQEGTPDRAGTGGGDTGTGTTSGSSSSTTTDNGDGTSTTDGTEATEINGPSTFGGHGDPASWWESEYPDGASGIATKFSDDMGQGAFLSILDPLKSLPDSGSEPSWSFNVDLGAMGNYGAVDLTLPSAVWLFIRFCILFTAVMTCRKLIFGG